MIDVPELGVTLKLTNEQVAALCVAFMSNPAACLWMLEKGYMSVDEGHLIRACIQKAVMSYENGRPLDAV